MTRVLYGYNLAASRPIDEIAEIAPRPIFMAHCQKDLMTPISHMDRLLSVARNTQTWKISNCSQKSIGRENVPERYNAHAVGYLIQPEEYSQKVIQFFGESLK